MHTNISLQQTKLRFSQMQTTPAALPENVTVTEELVLLVLTIASSLLTSSCMCQHIVHIIQKKFTELTHRVGIEINTENQVPSIQLCQSLIAACLQGSADRILWAQQQIFPCSLFACWFQPAQTSQPTVFSSHRKPAPASPNQHQHQPANRPVPDHRAGTKEGPLVPVGVRCLDKEKNEKEKNVYC